MINKPILDVCCGSRMFWFDKDNPAAIFMDNREEDHLLCDGRLLRIAPDVLADFTSIPYTDNCFHMVVFDPPHLIHAGGGSWLAKKYGVLPEDWQTMLSNGFRECMRVLRPNGVLVFKWCEEQIPAKDVLKLFDTRPIVGDQRGKTR